tara:strand:- start:89 stop:298 length:210 start_codon:yes stop_codon:yes gene_type:complete
MDQLKQTVTIVWREMADMPLDEGTYLVAFDDGTVETYPVSYENIRTGIIRDGRIRGVLWAKLFNAPQKN